MLLNHDGRPTGRRPPRTHRTARGRTGLSGGWATLTRIRGTRPFWGAVLSLLAALELYSLTVAPISVIVIQGLAGISTIVICLFITALTATAWSRPDLAPITGIAIVILSLTALLVSNLGGLLLGTLLGITGGALTYAWTPDAGRPPPRPRARRQTPAARPAGQVRPPGDVGSSGQVGPGQPGAAGRSSLVLPLVAVLLTAPAHQSAAAPPPAQAPRTVQVASPVCLPWPLTWVCTPSSPTPTSAVPPTRTSGPAATAPGTTTSPPPASTTTPAASTPAARRPSTTAAAPSRSTCSPSAYPARVPAVGSAAAVTAATALKACTAAATKDAPGASGTTVTAPGASPAGVSVQPGTLLSPRLTLTGLSYDGVVTLPTATGPVRVLKFHLDELRITDLDQTITDASGATLHIHAGPGDSTLTGHVQLDVRSLEGTAFGLLPLTFTPDSPPPATLPYLVLTDTTSSTAYLSADTLTTPGITLTSG